MSIGILHISSASASVDFATKTNYEFAARLGCDRLTRRLLDRNQETSRHPCLSRVGR